MAQLRLTAGRFEEKDVRLVAVSPADGASTEAVCGMLNVDCPCLGDPHGTAYDLYGLPRDMKAQKINWHVTFRAFTALLRGHRHGRVLGDRYRLPGSFIIDREGVVRWIWRGRDAADYADSFELLEALASLSLT